MGWPLPGEVMVMSPAAHSPSLTNLFLNSLKYPSPCLFTFSLVSSCLYLSPNTFHPTDYSCRYINSLTSMGFQRLPSKKPQLSDLPPVVSGLWVSLESIIYICRLGSLKIHGLQPVSSLRLAIPLCVLVASHYDFPLSWFQNCIPTLWFLTLFLLKCTWFTILY